MYVRVMIGILLWLAVHIPAAQAAGPVYTQACGGSEFAMALKSDGTVWSWGSNQQRQLGYDSGGAVVSFPTRIQSLHQITDIACGPPQAMRCKPMVRYGFGGVEQRGSLVLATRSREMNQRYFHCPM
ncbi:RCC1 domain-containing protein [Paenibacillus glucanolyticus]|uniref:RCC1 domain-containing protein n=1 Tax=Paenibacillus glucanolyticus TaxID=59843 RepID=UPI00128DCB29|nr:RCC1 domain-containing protein [Paenibacillus glucanolyticus]MPY19091.1 hypothetical protein [Paenibacillus glucanolyticus]